METLRSGFVEWWCAVVITTNLSTTYHPGCCKLNLLLYFTYFRPHFYGWSSTASRLEQLWRGSLLFATESSDFRVLLWSTSEGCKAESTWVTQWIWILDPFTFYSNSFTISWYIYFITLEKYYAIHLTTQGKKYHWSFYKIFA